MNIATTLLACAICASLFHATVIWQVLLCFSVFAGFLGGSISPIAAALVLAFVIVVQMDTLSTNGSKRTEILLTIPIIFGALAFALHLVPGFTNQHLFGPEVIGKATIPFSLYANLDKGIAGLILFVAHKRKIASVGPQQTPILKTVVLAPVTASLVLTTAYAIGYVRFDPKLPAFTPMWLTVNLLFVCVAEEAFFRGFIQTKLELLFASLKCRFGGLAAVLLSASLFALAHAGSVNYVLLSFIVGFGCAWSFYSSRHRLEIPIIVHFTTNVAHFLLFTYPK